jgi:hypothetical protein
MGAYRGLVAKRPVAPSGESLSGFFHAAWVLNPGADLGPAGGIRGRAATPAVRISGVIRPRRADLGADLGEDNSREDEHFE